jgi:PPOX class probable FMN-dependent enzyme
MEYIADIAALEAEYGVPGEASTRKVADRLTPEYRAWIGRSRFCVLTTVGPEGSDGSPRGDDGPVVTALDDRTLALPDWMGNNRIDSLRNIVRDGRVSLMFMIPGSTNVVRVNGRAKVTADAGLRARFERQGKRPRTVIVIGVAEVYFQCARALLRARLWTAGDESVGLPTAGQLLAAMTAGTVGGADYDAAWAERAAATMW